MFRRLGRSDETSECYRRALPVAQNEQVRRFIEQRLHNPPKMAHPSTFFVIDDKGC
jgi:predicted RNA polymerase sigma factor